MNTLLLGHVIIFITYLCTIVPGPSDGTRALESVQGREKTRAPVTAGERVAGVADGRLTEGVGEAQGTRALEGGGAPHTARDDSTRASILTNLRCGAGIPVLAELSSELGRASENKILR